MDKVYIVIAEVGAYSDYYERQVCFFEAEADADHCAAECHRLAKEIATQWCSDYRKWNDEHQHKNPWNHWRPGTEKVNDEEWRKLWETRPQAHHPLDPEFGPDPYSVPDYVVKKVPRGLLP